MDPRLPVDAMIAFISGIYVVVSVALGRTISLNRFSRSFIVNRRGNWGEFWIYVGLVATLFVGSAYWTVKLLISN